MQSVRSNGNLVIRLGFEARTVGLRNLLALHHTNPSLYLVPTVNVTKEQTMIDQNN